MNILQRRDDYIVKGDIYTFILKKENGNFNFLIKQPFLDRETSICEKGSSFFYGVNRDRNKEWRLDNSFYFYGIGDYGRWRMENLKSTQRTKCRCVLIENEKVILTCESQIFTFPKVRHVTTYYCCPEAIYVVSRFLYHTPSDLAGGTVFRVAPSTFVNLEKFPYYAFRDHDGKVHSNSFSSFGRINNIGMNAWCNHGDAVEYFSSEFPYFLFFDPESDNSFGIIYVDFENTWRDTHCFIDIHEPEGKENSFYSYADIADIYKTFRFILYPTNSGSRHRFENDIKTLLKKASMLNTMIFSPEGEMYPEKQEKAKCLVPVYCADIVHDGIIAFGWWDFDWDGKLSPARRFYPGHVDWFLEKIRETLKNPYYYFSFELDGLTVEDLAGERLAGITPAVNLSDGKINCRLSGSVFLKEIRRAVNRKKVEYVGGTYSQPYLQDFSGESNLRQFWFGTSALEKFIGTKVESYACQEYSFHSQLPQILSGFGIKHASLTVGFTRFGLEPGFDETGVCWKGPDGSKILAIPRKSFFVTSQAQGRYKSLDLLFYYSVLAKKSGLKEVYGNKMSDIFSRPIDALRMKKWRSFGIKFTTIKKYSRHVPLLPKEVKIRSNQWTNYRLWGRSGTNQVYEWNKKGEESMLTAEKFSTWSYLYGNKYPEEVLEKAWKYLLAAQNHDIYACPESQSGFTREAYFTEKGIGLIQKSLSLSTKVLSNALEYLGKLIDTSATGDGEGCQYQALIVFNSLSWRREEILEFKLHFSKGKVYFLRILWQGQEVPFQVLKKSYYPDGSLREIKLLFLADVPAFGYNVYHLDYSKIKSESSVYRSDLSSDEKEMKIENLFLKLKLDNINGGITELFHKELKFNLINPFPYPGNSFHGQFFKGIGETSKEITSLENTMPNIEIIEKGPLRITIEVKGKCGPFPFITKYVLSSRSPKIDITTIFDFGNKGVRIGSYNAFSCKEKLKMILNPSFRGNLYADSPFHVDWMTKKGVIGLNFADYSNKKMGISLINYGSSGYYQDKDINLSYLLFSGGPQIESGKYVNICSLLSGIKEIKYSLLPHAGNWKNGNVVQRSMEANTPLRFVVTNIHRGNLPSTKSFLRIDKANVILSALFVHDHKVIIRFVEIFGRKVKALIKLPYKIKEIQMADLKCKGGPVLKVDSDRLKLEVYPWKIMNIVIPL